MEFWIVDQQLTRGTREQVAEIAERTFSHMSRASARLVKQAEAGRVGFCEARDTLAGFGYLDGEAE